MRAMWLVAVAVVVGCGPTTSADLAEVEPYADGVLVSDSGEALPIDFAEVACDGGDWTAYFTAGGAVGVVLEAQGSVVVSVELDGFVDDDADASVVKAGQHQWGEVTLSNDRGDLSFFLPCS